MARHCLSCQAFQHSEALLIMKSMPTATNVIMSTLQERAQYMIWSHQHDIWVVLVVHNGEGVILALHDSLQSAAAE